MSSYNRKTKNPGWKSGDHWVECERTGMVIRSSDARKEWTGLVVAKEEWEPRHPQDFLRGIVDHTAAEGLINSESDPAYTGPISGAIAGIAIAGLAITGS